MQVVIFAMRTTCLCQALIATFSVMSPVKSGSMIAGKCTVMDVQTLGDMLYFVF